MLKVAVIIERAEIGLGGAERSVSELTAELRRHSIDACILAAKGTASDHVKILGGDHSGKRIRLPVFENALLEHFKHTRYDIIHSTLPLRCADIYQPRGGSYREAMLQNIASYPFALTRLTKRWTHFFNMRRTHYLRAEEHVCRCEKIKIAALSDYVRQQFLRHYHLSEQRIAVIPNGIHPDMRPDGKIVSEIQSAITSTISVPAGKQPVMFLFAANNPRLKGFRSLIWALKRVSRESSIHPVLMVAGTSGAGSYKNLIKQFGLENHVVFLGQVSHIANTLSICDVAVLPTWYDPCSRFILEALALGKPVITTRFNGAAERFTSHRHGIVLDRPDDIDALAEGMLYYCNREKIELAHKAILDDNLRQAVSIARHVEELINLYHRILKEKD